MGVKWPMFLYRGPHRSESAHIGKNISVIFSMTTKEACWVLTETGAERSVDDFVSLSALSCNRCYCILSVGDLKEDLKTHSGENSNKCSQWDSASSEADDLRAPLKMHSGEKSNKCNQCDYVSFQAGDLNKHLKIHSGEKPSKCSQIAFISKIFFHSICTAFM